MSQYVNLAIDFAGILIPNPFILAAGPATNSGEKIMRAFRSGWGGVVTKTIHDGSMPILEASPRFTSLKSSTKEIIGFENCEMFSDRTVEEWSKDIRKIKKAFPDRLLIASIAAANNKEAWQYMAMSIARTGANAIELNFSCPNGIPECGGGMAIGQNPELTRTITEWVREVVNIPLIVKLTPNVTDIVAVGQAAKDGGADILTAINTVQCLIGVDLDTLKPLPDINGQSVYGGYSGAAIRPIGLRAVSQLKSVCGMPIMGVGGIAKWQDAAEYFAVGASMVQVCTAAMTFGYTIIDDLTDGLSKYLLRKNFNSIKDLTGLALSRITDHTGLDKSRGVIHVDQEKCINCCRCLIACADGGHDALSAVRGGQIIVSDKCVSCGLCREVCPQGVFSFEQNLCEIFIDNAKIFDKE